MYAILSMQSLRDAPPGILGAMIANSVLFFFPTYLFHTILYPWLEKRRIRFDQESHATVSLSGLFSMDKQLQDEWLNAMQVAIGGLSMNLLEQALVESKAIRPLPSSSANLWVLFWQFGTYFVLFDCYYYFLHRFFFHSSWGWKMHRVHHRSLVCTPSTGFSFHWFEGVVTGGFNPFLAHCLSFDKKTVVLCQLYGILNTIFVHMGIQVVPTWWDQTWLTKWYLSSQFHDMHHEKVACNYGGFTTFWDYLFGTVHRSYADAVDRLADRINSLKND